MKGHCEGCGRDDVAIVALGTWMQMDMNKSFSLMSPITQKSAAA